MILGGLRDKNFKFRCIYVPTRLNILPVTQQLWLAWLGFGPISGIPMGSGRSFSLRIEGDSSVVSGSGRTAGESDRLAVVALREWLLFSSASLYKKGLATFQRLPLLTFA